MHVAAYDRDAAVAYARRWALDRNRAYYDFENVGETARILPPSASMRARG